MAAVIGALRADLSASVAKFEDDMGKAAKVVQRFGKDAARMAQQLESAGSRMTALITAPVVAFGVTALRAAGDFELSMNRVQAVTGATSKQFEAMKAQARELGATTQFMASDAAEAMGFLGMAGLKADQILAAMPHTLRLAASAQLDMARAADIVTNILAGYNLEIDDLARANDVLVKTFISANTNLEDLATAMKYAGPVAQAAGVEFEETAAALALMGNAGIQGSMAGTSLRGAISRIVNPTKQMKDAMRAAGLSLMDANGRLLPLVDILRQLEPHAENAGLFMQLFGQRAGPAMAALVSQGADAVAQLTDELRNSAGTAEEIAQVQMRGLVGAFRELKSAFEELQLAFADAGIQTLIEQLFRGMAELVRAIAAAPPIVMNLVAAFAGLLAVVGPLTWAFGAWLGAVANFAPFAAMLMTAMTDLAPVILRVVTVARAFALAFAPWLVVLGVVIAAAWEFRGAFQEAFGYAAEHFRTAVIPRLQELGAAFSGLFSAIGALLGSGPLSELVRFVGWAVAEIGALFMQGLGHVVVAAIGVVVDALTMVVEVITGVVNVVSALLRGDFVGAWEAAVGIVASVIDGFLSMLDNIVPGLRAAVMAMAAAVQQWVGEAIAKTLNWIQERFPGLVQAAAAMAQGVIAWARNLYQGVKTWINDNLGPVLRWARDRIRELASLFASIRRRQAALSGQDAPSGGDSPEESTSPPAGATAPPPPPSAAEGGGGGRSGSDDAAKKLIEAGERMAEALEDVNDSVDRAFGRDEMPRSLRAAADLIKRLDEAEAEAKSAGVAMGAFADQIQAARDRIEDLKQAALAREAQEFARRVQDVVDEIDDLSGALSPAERHMRSIERQFADLRLEIEEGIRVNAMLADSNDEAAAAMARLQAQLARLDAAQKRATEGAKALHEAQERLQALRAAAERGELERDIRDARRAGGQGGFMSSRAADLMAIEDDLARQRQRAAIDLAELEAELVAAEMDGNAVRIEQLNEAIGLQGQLYEIVMATSAEQVLAAEKLGAAFREFADGLSDRLADMLMDWEFDLDGVRNVFKQLAREIFIKPGTDAISNGLAGFMRSFAGGFAGGGSFGPGKWAITGEDGPEIIYSGASRVNVMSNRDSFGGGGRQGGDVIFNVSTPDADSFRRGQRQMARQAQTALAAAQ